MTSSKSNRPREYDIARRIDGQYGVWRWMQCPITPPYTVFDKDGMNKIIHVHRRWVIVAVRSSFKAALKWVRAQQEVKHAAT